MVRDCGRRVRGFEGFTDPGRGTVAYRVGLERTGHLVSLKGVTTTHRDDVPTGARGTHR